jgi:hypothetical protein
VAYGQNDDGLIEDAIPGDIACNPERHEKLVNVRSFGVCRSPSREAR